MPKTIYVTGHKSPDLDTVAGAISYAELKNKTENTDIYKPVILGDVNKETEHLLDKFNFQAPEKLESARGENMILVDHNEFSQSADGIEEAEILEVIDHHKVNFVYGKPISFCALPWGASCSIIKNRFDECGVEIDKELAGLMLGAILVDTVITKSPTCTEKDEKIIQELANIAGIDSWQDFGIEIFKVRASVSDLTAREIIEGDFKIFNTKAGDFGVGQVETADLSDFKEKEQEILKELEALKAEKSCHSMMLFITDILKQGSLFLVVSDDPKKLGEALGADFSEGTAYIDGIMSRKKQVTPKIEDYFN